MSLSQQDRDLIARLATALIDKWQTNPKWNGTGDAVGLAIRAGTLEEALAVLAQFGTTKALDLAKLASMRVSDRVAEAEEAITRFQSDHGLEIHEGILGLKTWRVLSNLLTCQSPDDSRREPLASGSWPARIHADTNINDRVFYYIDWETFGRFRDNIEGTKTILMINHAWYLWQKHANFAKTEVDAPAKANVVINMRNLGGEGGTLGVAHVGGKKNMSLRLECSMDSAEPWTAEKFQASLCHEFGHILGLDHDSESGTLMYPTYSGAVREPVGNDIARIVKEWGASEEVRDNPVLADEDRPHILGGGWRPRRDAD